MEKCDKAVMDFLIATDIGMFPAKCVEEEEEQAPAGFPKFHHISFEVSIDHQMISFHLSEGDDG